MSTPKGSSVGTGSECHGEVAGIRGYNVAGSSLRDGFDHLPVAGGSSTEDIARRVLMARSASSKIAAFSSRLVSCEKGVLEVGAWVIALPFLTPGPQGGVLIE
jgi:hypothetical protein